MAFQEQAGSVPILLAGGGAAPPLITLEVAQARLSCPPSLSPRPNSINIRTLILWLDQILTAIASYQSREHGYSGLILQPEVYALRATSEWTDTPNPGVHRAAGGVATEQRDAQMAYDALRVVFDSEQNVRQAICDALNVAVPTAYKKRAGTGIGTVPYNVTMNPREVLNQLRLTYGRPTPEENDALEKVWNQGWQPSEPIENLFLRLEECYITSLAFGVAYTIEQMTQKAFDAVRRTRLYQTAELEWQGFETMNQNWGEFKLHFTQAYEAAGGNAPNGYHGASNTMEDDDSLGSITQSIAGIQLANNAQQQATNDAIAQLTEQNQQMMHALQAMRTQTTPYLQPAPPPPPQQYGQWQPAAANAAMQPPAYIPPAYPTSYGGRQQQQGYGGGQGGGRGRGRGGRNGRNGRGGRGGRTNFGRGNQSHQTAGVPPATTAAWTGNIPPPANNNQGGGGYGRNQPNPYKRHNNWYYCYSCGYDVDHESPGCQYQRAHHQVGCTRANVDAYEAAGHRPSRAGKHKTILPDYNAGS